PFKYSLQFDPFPGRYIQDIVYYTLLSVDNGRYGYADSHYSFCNQRPEQVAQLAQGFLHLILSLERYLPVAVNRVADPDSGPYVGSSEVYTDGHAGEVSVYWPEVGNR